MKRQDSKSPDLETTQVPSTQERDAGPQAVELTPQELAAVAGGPFIRNG